MRRGEEIGCKSALLCCLVWLAWSSAPYSWYLYLRANQFLSPTTTRTVINNVTETIKHAWATLLLHTVPDDFPPVIYSPIDHSGAGGRDSENFRPRLKTFKQRHLIRTETLNTGPQSSVFFVADPLIFFLCEQTKQCVGGQNESGHTTFA